MCYVHNNRANDDEHNIIDHINSNKHNKKCSNLRWVTAEQNTEFVKEVNVVVINKKDNTFQEFPSIKKCVDCFLEHYPTINLKLASNLMGELDNHISYREKKRK
jgi:Zn-finger protein